LAQKKRADRVLLLDRPVRFCFVQFSETVTG
jgi:hypothetical protein